MEWKKSRVFFPEAIGNQDSDPWTRDLLLLITIKAKEEKKKRTKEWLLEVNQAQKYASRMYFYIH